MIYLDTRFLTIRTGFVVKQRFSVPKQQALFNLEGLQPMVRYGYINDVSRVILDDGSTRPFERLHHVHMGMQRDSRRCEQCVDTIFPSSRE